MQGKGTNKHIYEHLRQVLEFFHNSNLIRQIEQEKITKKFKT